MKVHWGISEHSAGSCGKLEHTALLLLKTSPVVGDALCG